MTKRVFMGVCLFVAAILCVGCKMTEADCMSTYNLIEKDKTACKTAFPELTETPEPAPGPKVILRKVAGDILEWKVDSGSGEVLQTTASATAWSTGKIRSDFVGTSLMDFAVHGTNGTSYTNVSYVIFQTKIGSDVYTIEMMRTAGDKIRWYVSKGSSRKLITADSSLSTTEVPQEFTAALQISPTWTFREELEDVTIDEVNFLRVGM